MPDSINLTPEAADSTWIDANGDELGVRVYVPRKVAGSHFNITPDAALRWARQLTLAADEAADAAVWTPDEEQIEKFRTAFKSLTGIGSTRLHATNNLRALREVGLL